MTSTLPLVEELSPVPEVLDALAAIRSWPHPLLLESALRRTHVGRYSFLTAAPYQFLQVDRVTPDEPSLTQLGELLQNQHSETVPGLPPFQGGMAGLIGYEAGQIWERIPDARYREFPVPDLALGLYDWVLAWDHELNRAWIIAQGWSAGPSEAARLQTARQRIAAVKERLSQPGVRQTSPSVAVATPAARIISDRATPDRITPVLASSRLAPQYAVPGHPLITSSFTREAYLETVQRAIDYIYAGDIFQVNLSQRLLTPLRTDPLTLYSQLRARNPAPFAAYFEHSDWVVASASPERFVKLSQNDVETRPIKGTRRRQKTPEADLFTGDELRESEKDHAENVMIVDLLRNDLSKVCQPGSIRVPELCHVELYETVQHLVSQVCGRLRPQAHALDLFPAAFPGGSITGAPKVRAMQIIAELEPTVRGPYCGSLCYVGYDGQMDSSILIRTFTISRGWVQFPAGGGIVAQSDPESEYLETLHKAAGMLRALE